MYYVSNCEKSVADVFKIDYSQYSYLLEICYLNSMTLTTPFGAQIRCLFVSVSCVSVTGIFPLTTLSHGIYGQP